ncbi:probable disease resistance protein At5g45440 [Triticum urartu]|uniref:probable disease resistance protein At5g45440 n=1 Tax=Triticum urartu TaxID=4572 RepID=UPI002043AF2A|nr:probable disease resistance protein At5g45440 [Triticum urartu]
MGSTSGVIGFLNDFKWDMYASWKKKQVATTEKSSIKLPSYEQFLTGKAEGVDGRGAQFLLRKFVDSMAEEGAAELPFSSHFYDMRAGLEKAAISSTNADELRECMYELNSLLSQCRVLTNRPNTRSCFFSPSEAWLSNKVKQRVIAVKRRVLQCVQNDDPNGDAAALQQESTTTAGFSRWTTSWVEESRIYGFDQQLAELESRAFGDSSPGRLTGAGIVGMGGIGKTALAQLVFNSPMARRRFFPRIWVCLSRTSCIGKDVRNEVLQSILMALGLEEEFILAIDSLGDLEVAVHEQLKGKRYLIVFDDVWNVDDWYADIAGHENALSRGEQLQNGLMLGLPKERGGVVVTSRQEQAAEMMVGKGSVYRVEPLADRESAWAIFMDALNKERQLVDLAAINNLKEEILQTCGGLPSMAKAMADIFAKSLTLAPSTSSQELKLE